MTGPFKRYGRFNPHHNLADWHYSGTYFWMRHAHVFARDYQIIPQFYGGVETWPGTVFQKEETGCVFLDDLGPSREHMPYYLEFWHMAEPPKNPPTNGAASVLCGRKKAQKVCVFLNHRLKLDSERKPFVLFVPFSGQRKRIYASHH